MGKKETATATATATTFGNAFDTTLEIGGKIYFSGKRMHELSSMTAFACATLLKGTSEQLPTYWKSKDELKYIGRLLLSLQLCDVWDNPTSATDVATLWFKHYNGDDGKLNAKSLADFTNNVGKRAERKQFPLDVLESFATGQRVKHSYYTDGRQE